MTEIRASFEAKLKEIAVNLQEGRPIDPADAVAVVAEGLRNAASSSGDNAGLHVFAVLAKMGEDPTLCSALFHHSEGVAETFVAALRRADTDIVASHNGIAAIDALAFDASFRKALTAAGAVPRLVAMLQRKDAPPVTLMTACHALHSFAGKPGEHADADAGARAAVMEAAAPEALVHVLKGHLADEIVAPEACGALWALANFPEPAATLRRAGAVQALLAVLQEQMHRAETADPACQALSLLIKESPCRRELYARDCAGIRALVDILRRHEATPRAVRAACGALVCIGADTEPLALLVHDAAPLLVSAMRRHKDDVELVRDVLATLTNIVRPAHRTELVRVGVLSAVVEAMQQYPYDGRLAEYACTILCAFEELDKQDAELQALLRRESMTIGKVLIHALRRLPGWAVVAWQACRAFTSIIKDASEAQAAAFIREGAVLGYVAALQHFPSNVKLVEAACLGLDELTSKNPSHVRRDEMSLVLAEAKLTEPLAAALRASLGAGGAAADRSAFLACWLMARVAGISTETIILARFGVAADIVAALTRLKAMRPLASTGCFVLKCLALVPEARASLLPVLSDAVEALGQATRAHAGDAEVVMEAAGALDAPGFKGAPTSVATATAMVQALTRQKAVASITALVGMAMENLCINNEASKRAFLKAGAVRAIVAAMALHQRDSRCATAACNVFHTLAAAGGGVGGTQVATEGACPVLAESLRVHVSDAKLAKSACGAFINLALSDAGRAALTRAGALPLVVNVLVVHKDDADVATCACGAVSNWVFGCKGDESGKHAAALELVRAGAAPPLAAVLRRHLANERYAAAACSALHAVVDVDALDQLLGPDHHDARLASGRPSASALAVTVAAGSSTDKISGRAGAAVAAAGGAGAAAGGGAGSSADAARPAASDFLASLVPALALALKVHVRNADIAMPSCKVAARLACVCESKPAVAELLLRSGLMKAVVGALRLHAADPEVVASACSTLALIPLDGANRAALVAEGALEAVRAAQLLHSRGTDATVPVLRACMWAEKKLTE